MNAPTFDIDSFLGIHNREQPRRLPKGALTKADNVDIDDAAGLILRTGYSSSLPLSNVTSAFSTQDERRSFIVSDGNLLLIKSDLSFETIATGIASDYIHWLEVADTIIMSDGLIIAPDNQVSNWRIPRPSPPNITITSGNLRAGQYQLVVTNVDETGREGGASDIVTVNVENGSAIVVDSTAARIYATDVNGSVFYYHASTTIDATINNTSPLDDAQLKGYAAPENTKHLAYFENKVFTAELDDGQSTVWFSQPYWHNLFDLQNDFIIIPGRVTCLAAVPQGLIIGTEDEIHVYTPEEVLYRLADYGMPSGKSFTIDDKGIIYLHTNQGLCTFPEFTNHTENKVSLPPGSVAHVDLIEQGGMRKIVVLTDNLTQADNKLF